MFIFFTIRSFERFKGFVTANSYNRRSIAGHFFTSVPQKTSLNDSKNPTTAEKDTDVQKNDANSTAETYTEISTAVDNNYPATDKDGWVTKWY